MSEVLEQRIKQLEETQKEHTEEIKEIQRLQNNHAVTIAEIKVIIESMKVDWARLSVEIQQAMSNQNTNTSAWKEVLLETLKTMGMIIGAIIAAKWFIGK
jgi:predicted nuclease with TOPRIM domain